VNPIPYEIDIVDVDGIDEKIGRYGNPYEIFEDFPLSEIVGEFDTNMQ